MRNKLLPNYIPIRRRRRRRLLLCALALMLLPAFGFIGYIASREAWHILDPEKLSHFDESLLVYDRDGAVLSQLYKTENRVSISVRDLPAHVTNAFIAAEDARFYTHEGVDLIRICGAALADLKAGSFKEGASTITQQLIKLTHLSAEKTLTRKLDEAILSYRLEHIFNKEQILEAYLNRVYFGAGYYGVEAAARGYFGVGAKDLTLAQSALLAGILKSPARFAPHLRPEASVGRRGVILDLMVEYGMISSAQAAAAKEEPLVLAEDTLRNRHSYAIDLALTDACELLDIDMSALLTGGYRIETGIDSRLQGICEDAFADDSLFPYYGDKSAEGAIVLLEADTGHVAAIVGGRDDRMALAYNRATRIRRQPGSAIKPVLVYAPALEAGYTAVSMLLDDAAAFADYTPRNASGTYRGWVTMREAVTRSLNLPAVSLCDTLGIDRCKAFAARLGIPFDARDNALALALGGFTYGVSPLQLCGAYSAFANGGVYRKPHTVLKILDRNGQTVYEAHPEAVRVMREGNAFVLTDMLESVVQSGTAKSLSELPMALAAKTGTVGDENGNRDIWLAAYNPEYAAVVWMGFDRSDNGEQLPPDIGGGSYPAELLKRVFGAIYDGAEAPDFRVPSDVVAVPLDQTTLSAAHEAVLASSLTPDNATTAEYFVRGTEPVSVSAYWQVPAAPEDLAAERVGDVVTLTFSTPQEGMQYRVYREDASGFSILLATVNGSVFPQQLTDAVPYSDGIYAYYIVPVHPRLYENGAPLCGNPSRKIFVGRNVENYTNVFRQNQENG